MVTRSAVIVVVIVAIAAGSPESFSGAAAEGAPRLSETRSKVDDALGAGVRWLAARQNADGGFGPSIDKGALAGASDVGLSAFAAYALARSPESARGPAKAMLEKGIAFLLSRQQSDGSIADPREPSLLEYKTSVALLALVAHDRGRHAAAIEKAREFIKSRQFVEKQGFSRESPSYGGFGYDPSPKGQANLSVVSIVSQALHESGLSSGDKVWEQVQVFLSRGQNAPKIDPVLEKLKIGSTRDYGFRYGPDQTRGQTATLADGTRTFSSYGSMTYAGLLSFLYAGVTKDDERVKGAFAWISQNFHLELNPGMATEAEPQKGLQGLFYYYHTMAKALSVYGEAVVTDKRGVRHDWALELGERLAAIQQPGGWWVNKESRWLEDKPELASSYAIVALSIVREELAKRLASPEPAGK